ncbi:hypothetical protein HK098_006178 [Nowakowskiella sp. JEL0407]|nr:hypothetical protein HK098_006178 [Nowakowskiella sp. JEL0407]
MNDTYDVFISYCPQTNPEIAELLNNEVLSGSTMKTRIYLEEIKIETDVRGEMNYLSYMTGGRVHIPIISNKLIKELAAHEELCFNLFLKWDAILDAVADSSEQMMILLFVGDETGPFRFNEADQTMKDLFANNCTRNSEEIWNTLRKTKAGSIDDSDGSKLNFFVQNVQEQWLEFANRHPKKFELYENYDPKIFINCDEEMYKIEGFLERNDICNLWGLDGLGKTFVAKKIAFRMFKRGYSIACLSAYSEETLTIRYQRYLKNLLGLEALPVSSETLEHYLEFSYELRLPKQFIILDYVNRRSDIELFIRYRHPNVKFLITSRRIITEPAVAKDFYAEDVCIEYLKKMTDRGFTDQQCKQIYEVTNGFPERLREAALILQNPDKDLQTYLGEIETEKARMSLPFRAYKDDYTSYSSENQFKRSIERLLQTDENAYLYLTLLAQIDLNPIMEKYFIECIEDYQKRHWSALKRVFKQINYRFSVDIMELSNEKIAKFRSEALKLGFIQPVSTHSRESSPPLAIQISPSARAELRDHIKGKPTILNSALEIATLYEKKTKSCTTLCTELKTSQVDSVTILLQSWTSCEIDVSLYKLTSSDLDTLCTALAETSSVKKLTLNNLTGPTLQFISTLIYSKLEYLEIAGREFEISHDDCELLYRIAFRQKQLKISLKFCRLPSKNVLGKLKEVATLESCTANVNLSVEIFTSGYMVEGGVVTFELCVNEILQPNAKRFDQFVTSAIKACVDPLFKAAFLSTVLSEYLDPISNRPYVETANAQVEEGLQAVLMKLDYVAMCRKRKNFKSLLAEVSPLLAAFEFAVTEGPMNIIAKIDRGVVGDEVVDAVKAVFRRNAKIFCAGAAITSGICAANDIDEKLYNSDSLEVAAAKITENGITINVTRLQERSSTPSGAVSASSNYRDMLSCKAENAEKFNHLGPDLRSKVARLQKDQFSLSDEPCNERKYYHDFFISYRREPKSEIARDWLTIALAKINERRNQAGRPFHWFVDVDCLDDGQPFTEQFLGALLNAKIVFLLITEETLNRFNACRDNVILEWEWALHLKQLHSKRTFRIQPLFIGNVDPVKDFDFSAVNQLSTINNLTVKHAHELSPQELSLKEVFDTIFGINGKLVDFTRNNFINQIRCLLEIDGPLQEILNT